MVYGVIYGDWRNMIYSKEHVNTHKILRDVIPKKGNNSVYLRVDISCPA